MIGDIEGGHDGCFRPEQRRMVWPPDPPLVAVIGLLGFVMTNQRVYVFVMPEHSTAWMDGYA